MASSKGNCITTVHLMKDTTEFKHTEFPTVAFPQGT